MRVPNPFKPGAGGLPPYLAGRDTERSLLLGLFEDLRAGSPPARPVIFYAPRGNGRRLSWRGPSSISRAAKGWTGPG